MVSELFPKSEPCQHTRLKTTLTPELKHYAREDCEVCGKFIRWLPKPETLAKDKRNADRLASLSKRGNLTEWERGFVLSLQKQGRNFSPRQQEQLDSMIHRYGFF